MKKFTNMFILALISICEAVSPTLRYAWKEIDYSWPSPADRQNAIREDRHVPGNQMLSGIGIWKTKMFITVPRLLNGVVSSLNYIDLNEEHTAPLLKPYPTWEDEYFSETAKEMPSNRTLVSVCRIAIDDCDRLWAIDTGIIGNYGTNYHLATPSIVIFDLNTDQLLHRYYLKPSDIKNPSFFANIAVDVTKETCADAFAYIADLEGFGAVVYSLKADDSWRVNHPYFHIDPMACYMNTNGLEFVMYDGLFGFTLSEPQSDGYRTAFFHPFASTKEFSVSTEVLRTFPRMEGLQAFTHFKVLGDRGNNTQSSSSVYDPETNVLFYAEVNKNAIACWNTKKPYNVENNPILMSDLVFEFINELRMTEDGSVWFLVNKYARFLSSGLDANDVNYSIYTFNAKQMIAGTACE